MSECVRVRKKERARERESERARESERERERERESDSERKCMRLLRSAWPRGGQTGMNTMCACVCVWESECVCERVCARETGRVCGMLEREK